MPMIDTHAHLNFSPLSNQIDNVIKESKKAGLTGIVIASSNLKDSIVSIELAKKYPDFLYASVGLHPQNTDPQDNSSIEEQIKKLESLLATNYLPCRQAGLPLTTKIVAIGETGLDFSEAPAGEKNRNHEDQEKLFKSQIDLAKKYKLPLIIHAREAVDEVIALLGQYQNLNGVFHCYAGGKKRIKPILNLPGTWYFGFDGNLTYDEGLQGIIPLIPKDRLIIETDSPFLAPAPRRGETNTPANLPFIQQKINEVLNEDLTAQILENTKKLFNFR